MNAVTITKELSSRLVDGKKQVLVRATISRTNRPRFKTGVMVPPSFFKNGEIIKSKRGPKDLKAEQAAIEASIELTRFCSRLTEIIQVASENLEVVDKGWIETVMELDNLGKIKRTNGTITIDAIRQALVPNTSLSVLTSQTPQRSIQEEETTQSAYRFFDLYITSKNLAKSRAVNYKVLARILFRFEQFERLVSHREGFVFSPATISTDDILAFRTYMSQEGELAAKYPKVYDKIYPLLENALPRETNHRSSYGVNNKSENYVIAMLKKLSSLQKWLCDTLKVVNNNPFVGMTIGTEQVVSHPVYLTKEERNKIADFDFSDNPKLETQRDIFIFQCMTGCRYEDLRALTPDNIVGTVLEYVPLKTSKNKIPAQPRIPLSEKTLSLARKYQGLSDSGKLFPTVTTCTFNIKLKQIFEICGIKRKVYVLDARKGEEVQKSLCEIASSHLARRTFIGNAYKVVKDPCIISSMSGHAEHSRSFERYRDIDDQIRQEVIALIE